ncbi:hypothetical protein C8Q76DRAFT_222192 [Earliella scabrosa]|nr:hypothetical protein C8Q76DRAFT_222192 [Earliella scabrosa]
MVEEMANWQHTWDGKPVTKIEADLFDDYGEERQVNMRIEKTNEKLVKELGKIHRKHINNSATGSFSSFKLKITREGCKSSGRVNPPRSKTAHERSSENAKIERKLAQWYRAAAISGYGDMHEQVTKVDPAVRNAREIPASEFAVEPELLARIAACWDEHFVPTSGVRVEPYKIHLYGPGGHFKTHRDTPERDLVGTFLLGLGDTTPSKEGKERSGLYVAGKPVRSPPCAWCAFYPDVPHSVERIESGYRAVIAFKVFRRPGDGDARRAARVDEVRGRVEDIIGRMRAPFGLLLEHRYAFGTSAYSAFDELVVQSAEARAGCVVHHFPVIVRSHAEWDDPEEEDPTFQRSCRTEVFPFTQGHCDALNTVAARKEWQPRLSHTECGYPALEGVEDVPFFSMDFDQDAVFHSGDEKPAEDGVFGNEARAWREDSVYFSYAVLVLPDGDGDEVVARTVPDGSDGDGSSSDVSEE